MSNFMSFDDEDEATVPPGELVTEDVSLDDDAPPARKNPFATTTAQPAAAAPAPAATPAAATKCKHSNFSCLIQTNSSEQRRSMTTMILSCLPR